MHAEKCPVCNGNGLVSNGFYNQVNGEWASGSTAPEKCRSCNGKGWVEVNDGIKFDETGTKTVDILRTENDSTSFVDKSYDSVRN